MYGLQIRQYFALDTLTNSLPHRLHVVIFFGFGGVMNDLGMYGDGTVMHTLVVKIRIRLVVLLSHISILSV